MTHTYQIEGMTCQSCVAKIKSALLSMGDVAESEVQLQSPQAKITMLKHIPTPLLQNAISKAGNFVIRETHEKMHKEHSNHQPTETETNLSWFKTYKPVLLIGAYITGGTLLFEMVNNGFDPERWMNHFMAFFFLVFSFFKLLDLRAFADSYASYDIIAKRWYGWGLVYPFVELGLGLAFLFQFQPLLTNGLTFVVMALSIVGVLQSVLNKKKIRCACLGAVFNLPMSTITIIEDGLMIVMSAVMIVKMIG